MTPVTAEDLRQFLCPLYFASHYCYPPYLPKTDIDLDADNPPLRLTFRSIESLEWSDIAPQQRQRDMGVRLVLTFFESPITLGYYFDCAALMAQCEAVMLTAGNSWCWLLFCHHYRLDRAKKDFIERIVDVSGLLKSEQYKRAKQNWDKELVLELVEADCSERMIIRMQCAEQLFPLFVLVACAHCPRAVWEAGLQSQQSATAGRWAGKRWPSMQGWGVLAGGAGWFKSGER